MSARGMKESEILGPVTWPREAWSDHFDFVASAPESDGEQAEMSEAEGVLISYLDAQQLQSMRADITMEPKGRGTGFRVKLKLNGVILRRCALSGVVIEESVRAKDQFDFVKPARNESAQKRLEAQLSQDLGTGLDDGPDVWDEEQPPTLVGLIADALEDVMEPMPMAPGAQVASEFAEDPQEALLSQTLNPFAALQGLKKNAE